MASTLSLSRTGTGSPASTTPSHRWFHVALLVTAAWTVGGAYLDGWAHHFRAELETFFTPWHAVLYSGFAASAAVLVLGAVLSRRRTGSWRAGLAPGAGGALAGAALFAAGGVGDMLWHIAFGVEADLEALLSPTHLVLVVGVALIVSAPLRGAWGTAERVLPWTAAVSASLLLAVVSFITVYAQPFAHPHASRHGIADILHESGPSLGVLSILWGAGLLTGFLLVLARRFVVPVGVGTLVVGAHGVLLALMEGRLWLLPATLLAVLVIELLLHRLGRGGIRELRILGAGIPVALYGPYFLVIAVMQGLGWSVHLRTGAIASATLVGLLVSYAVAPPAGADRIGAPGR